jgi:hypothetical protein
MPSPCCSGPLKPTAVCDDADAYRWPRAGRHANQVEEGRRRAPESDAGRRSRAFCSRSPSCR